MGFIFTISVLLAYFTRPSLCIPTGFQMKVESECGDSYNVPATITFTTDLTAIVTAVCADGDHPMNVSGRVHHVITAHYSSSSANGGCQFFRRANTRTYLIYLVMVVTDTDVGLQKVEDEFTVTCDFGDFANNKSNFHTIMDSYLAPLEVSQQAGPEATSNLTIYVVSMDGVKQQNNTDLVIMKTVRLVIETDGSSGEQGLQVVSCDGLGNIPGGMRYPMIRAGCGDGLLLPVNEGFTTHGLKAVSYPFQLFHVAKDNTLKFDCTVVLCSQQCNGSSCATERKRRLAQDIGISPTNDDVMVVETLPVLFKNRQSSGIWRETDVEILVTILSCFVFVIINFLLMELLFPKKNSK